MLPIYEDQCSLPKRKRKEKEKEKEKKKRKEAKENRDTLP